MINFKKHIFRLSHIPDPFVPCDVISGVDKSGTNPVFYLDGFNDTETISITYLLYDVFNNDGANLMSIGINGTVLTENVPLTISVTVTPNVGYDYQGILNPLTNYNENEDSFKIDMVVNNIGGSPCTDNTSTETMIAGTPTQPMLLWYDENTACPTLNPITYYINTDDFLTATILSLTQSNYTPAPAGHYSPSENTTNGFGSSREWDGVTFLTTEACT